MEVGFIGLGTMGTPMCLSLLKSGVDLSVYNRTKDKTTFLVEKGAASFGTIEELADHCEVVIVMVADDAALDEILLEAKLEGRVLVNMSTISLKKTQELVKKAKEEKFTFINAPVSGTKKPAEDGTLIILFGGDEDVLPKLEPLFMAMGKAIIKAGSQEDATKLKLVVNFLLGGMLEHYAESIAICHKIGLDVNTFTKTVEEGPLGCGFFNIKKDNLVNQHFEPAFMAKHMFKDLKFLEEALRDKNQKIHSNIIELFSKANEAFPDQDLTSIYKFLEH